MKKINNYIQEKLIIGNNLTDNYCDNINELIDKYNFTKGKINTAGDMYLINDEIYRKVYKKFYNENSASHLNNQAVVKVMNDVNHKILNNTNLYVKIHYASKYTYGIVFTVHERKNEYSEVGSFMKFDQEKNQIYFVNFHEGYTNSATLENNILIYRAYDYILSNL